MIRERSQAVREPVGARPPVAEPGPVTGACAEPGVVHDEDLDAEICGQFGELPLLLLADVELGRLPRVEDERAFGGAGGEHLPLDVGVPAAAGAAEAVGCVQTGEDGGLQTLSGAQLPDQPLVTESAGPGGAAVGVAAQGDAAAAAPGQGRAPDLAVLLGGVVRVEHQPGSSVRSRDAEAAGEHGLPDGNPVALELELPGPFARHMADPVVVAGGQRPGGGVEPEDVHRFPRGEDGPAFDLVMTVPDPVVEVEAEGADAVGEGEREQAVLDRVRDEPPREAADAVVESDSQRRRTEPQTALHPVLLTAGIVAAGVLGGQVGRDRDGLFQAQRKPPSARAGGRRRRPTGGRTRCRECSGARGGPRGDE